MLKSVPGALRTRSREVFGVISCLPVHPQSPREPCPEQGLMNLRVQAQTLYDTSLPVCKPQQAPELYLRPGLRFSANLIGGTDMSMSQNERRCGSQVPNNCTGLKALSMDDGWARLVILSLRDPHLLEGAQGGQDGATNPDTVLPLRRSHNFDFHCGGCQCGQLLGHALTNALEHSGSP